MRKGKCFGRKRRELRNEKVARESYIVARDGGRNLTANKTAQK